MAQENTAEAVNDTGIPADMVVDGAEAPDANGDPTGLATRLGWQPKDQYRGPEGKWLDAGAFVEKVEKETPVLRERLRFQDKMINQQQEKLRELGEVTRELLETSRQAEARGYARMRKEIEERRSAAVAEADIAGFESAERELAELDKAKPKGAVAKEPATAAAAATSTETKPAHDPAMTEWLSQNTWFNRDVVLNQLAIGFDLEVQQEMPDLGVADRLAEVTKRVKEARPEKFANPARKAPSTVNGGANPPVTTPRTPKKKTVADLPEDAKAALARFKRLIPAYKDQDYLDSYKWDKQS